LNSDGSDLVYSTYFGGYDYEGARAIAVDEEGNAYLTGDTTSNDYPVTTGAYDETYNGGRDCFLLEFNSDGSDLIFSTYLGGTDDDIPNDLELADDGTLWIAGYTLSDDYPTTDDAYDREMNDRDFIISQLSSDGSDLEHSTYAGGSLADEAWTLSVQDQIVYVAGRAYSEDFPVTGQAIQKENHGGMDAIIFRLDISAPASEQMTYCTYLGGSENEASWEMKLSGTDICIAGLTASEDFPTTEGSFQEESGGGIDPTVWRMNIENELGNKTDDGNGGNSSGVGGNGTEVEDEDDEGDGDDDDDDFLGIGRNELLMGVSVFVLIAVIASVGIMKRQGKVHRKAGTVQRIIRTEDGICPNCSNEAEWVGEYQDYYCGSCEEYVGDME